MTRKMGPLTREDLRKLWESGVDLSYARPFVEGQAEGRETGFEVFEQGIEQMAWVSETVDRSTQAMFIMPWSGQTDAPARGANNAMVALRFERTARFELPLTLTQGQIVVAEVMKDYGAHEAQYVRTGRRFILAETAAFAPGNAGPLYVEAEAELPGFGGNHSPEGTLVVLEQPGATLHNARASIVIGTTSHRLVAWSEPDVPVPEHVGQYVEFVAGVNAGRVLRVIGYERPNPDAPHGGVLVLDAADAPDMVSETGTAVWRMLPWHAELGIRVTNETQPTGGVAAMLDELGDERGLPRTSGESDDDYRKRTWALSDVVSPNAIRRVVNRILAPFGAVACVREVGLEKFRGLFFDGDPSSTDPSIAFAWDMDFVKRPQDRWKVWLDTVEMRAFFLVGVPPLALGEFGMAFDEGLANAWDVGFFDGYPVGAAAIYRSIWSAVDNARAAGVGFDLYVETGGCIA